MRRGRFAQNVDDINRCTSSQPERISSEGFTRNYPAVLIKSRNDLWNQQIQNVCRLEAILVLYWLPKSPKLELLRNFTQELDQFHHLIVLRFGIIGVFLVEGTILGNILDEGQARRLGLPDRHAAGGCPTITSIINHLCTSQLTFDACASLCFNWFFTSGFSILIIISYFTQTAGLIGVIQLR